MSFDARIAQVRQAENAVSASRHRVSAQWRQAAGIWRSAWTPGRIVIAGLALGFLGGRTQPLKLAGKLAGDLAGNGGLLELLGTLSGLIGSMGAQGPAAPTDPAQPSAEAADEPAT